MHPNHRHWNRFMFYSFLRTRKKPQKGDRKIYKLPPIEEEEDVLAYFDRCHEEVGVRPAPIGPIKKIKPNSKCMCKSGRKYKTCCGRESA